jgi:hypothetical protein
MGSSAGSSINLGMPRTPSFSRSRQDFHAKRSGRLSLDVIFNFNLLEHGAVGIFLAHVAVLVLGLPGLVLREFMAGNSSDDKLRDANIK